jgi:hypothetical protein
LASRQKVLVRIQSSAPRGLNMTNILVENYLVELEIQESIQIITERFDLLTKEKILHQVKTNSSAIKKYLLSLGLDIKKITLTDAKNLGSIIRTGFEEKESIQDVAKKVIKYTITLIKRIWNPSGTAEKIASSMILGVVLTLLVAFINLFGSTILTYFITKLSSGVSAVALLLLKWFLLGPITEELMKRFFLKKLNSYGFISTALFAGIETVQYATKADWLSQLLFRLITHLFTTSIQKLGIYFSEKTGKKWIEYIAFIIAVIFHAAINFNAELDRVGFDALIKIMSGSAKLVR